MDAGKQATVPHLSPSLTASVNSSNSSSLPTPREDDLDLDYSSPLTRTKHQEDLPPGARRAPRTTSREPAVFSGTLRARTSSGQQRMLRRFLPYNPRAEASPLELRFLARSMGLSSHNGLTLEDVEAGRVRFMAALSALPDRLLRKAYHAKQASRECIARRLSVALAEIESAERTKDYLISITQDYAGKLSTNDAALDILKRLMEERGLDDAEDDGGFHRAIYADELIALSIANAQVSQVQEAMGSRPGYEHFPSTAREYSGEEDNENDNGDIGDDYSEIAYPELTSSDTEPGM